LGTVYGVNKTIVMRIFELTHADGEKEWISGNTNIEALNHYVFTTECDLYEMLDSELTEVPKEKWKDYLVINVDEPNFNFEEFIKANQRGPEIIAGTMYDMPEGDL
jgi:hypothetical protein